jgi:O-acetyl-ADP-ribose deacetylase (regulator of RNase III)
MKIRIGKSAIEILQGDITEQDTEAIVNAANNHLWMGVGVAGTIKRKGGAEIEQEAVAQGPIEVGEAVATKGGTLKAKYVIHAAGMGQDLRTDETKVRLTTHNSLELADKRGIRSISFPAIGTGVGGFEVHLCAKVMLDEVIDFLQTGKNLERVAFVLFDAETLEVFQENLKSRFSVKRGY